MTTIWYHTFRKHLWFFFLLICSYWGKAAAEEYGGAQEVTATECMPSSLVNQSVCAMTGEYVISTTQLVLPGPEQLVIGHTYTNSLLSNWALNHRDTMCSSTWEVNDKKMTVIGVRQPSGSQLDYKCLEKNILHHERSSFHLIVPKGLTTAASLVSGRRNLRNQKVSYDSKKKEFKIVSPSGDRSLFRKKKDPKGEAYIQESMQRMNGGLYRYKVSDTNIFALTEISCQSKKSGIPYSKVNFRTVELEKKNRYRSSVIANDGRTVDYTFDCVTHRKTDVIADKNQRFVKYEKLLLAVDGPYVIPETYKYERRSGSKYHQVNRRERPDFRFLNIHYYHKGKNHVGGNVGEVTVKDDDVYLPNRVKRLEAPVGRDSTPITTHRFDYKINKKKSKKTGNIKQSGGSTDVYDAYNHLKTFAYDKNHHVTAITHFRGINHYSPYREECFVWGDRVGIPTELLSTTYLVNKKKHKISYIKCFHYDERGNVLEADLCGDLTGHSSSKIKLHNNGWPVPENYEAEVKRYSYNDRNLLVSEEDAYGKVFGYLYFKNTDNILRKNTWGKGKIFLREEFDYDNNFALTRKTSDDGVHGPLDDLTGVTERHITVITPRTSYPVGLPDMISEWFIDDFQAYRGKVLKTTFYEYSSHGHLTRERVFDAEDRHAYDLTWEYDPHGNAISETNPLGHQTIRTYDSNDNLILEIDPSGLKTEYHYDYSNRLLCKRAHHSDGVMSSSFDYDHLGNCIGITDSFGNKTTQEFDEFNRVVAIYQPHVLNEHGQIVQPIIRKHYDIMDNVISEIDPRGIETKTEYNIRHQPTKITYIDGTYELFRYRLDGELSSKRERNGLTTVYEREELGRICEEKLYSEDGVHLTTTRHEHNSFHLTKTIDPSGLETRYSYDKAGRLEKIETGERMQQHFYDPLGRVQEVREFFQTNPQAYLSTFKTYDLLNRLTEETLKTADGRILLTSQHTYDIRGNCIRSQKGDQVTTYTYDTHDQLIETRDGLGHVTTTSYNRNFINPFGQRVLHKITTDPLGFQTLETYDAANRLVELKRQTPVGVVIACQEILYDLSGNKCRTFDTVYQDGIEQRKIETRYTYTATNTINSLTEAVGTPEEKTTTYHYNHLGQLAFIIKPDGTHLYHIYDPFGRLYNMATSNGTVNYTLLYNLNNQIEQAIDNISNQVTERHYDLYGELRAEKQGHGIRLTYDYDLLGRLIKIGLPEGTTIEYLYDGNLKEIRRLKNGQCLYTHRNESYNTAQQLLSSKLPGDNGIITYQYDPLGRCVSLNAPTFSQSIPPTGFDAAGNLRHFIRQDEAYHFDYDDYYHLKSESGPINHTYSYDSLQNRLSYDDDSAQVNALNQLQKQGNEQLVYDKNGNLIQRTTNGSSTQYTYDALDRLTSITHNGRTVVYTYDPFNRRLMKHIDGRIDLFAYHDQDEIGLWRADHSIQELRIASPTIRPSTTAIELNGTPYIPIHDLTGHIVTLLDLAGHTIESYRYSAFGEREIFNREDLPQPTSPIGNPWQYSEKRYDEESGLLAFGLRYYDPKLGRWISQDPAEFEDGPNRYAYVHNNPLILFDRYGLFSQLNTPLTGFYPLHIFDFSPQIEMSQACLGFAWDTGKEIMSNPYVYGSMQAIGGLAEVGIGAGMAAYTGGIAGALGWPMMAQGVDHYATGVNTLLSGIPQQTSTSKLLQQTGMSQQYADLIDNTTCVFATIGGAASLKVSRAAAKPEFMNLGGLGRTTTTVQTIDPTLVRFSQDSIKKTFRDGRCIYKLVEDLKSGVVKANEIPPIRLFDCDGVLYSLDNRRLEVFKRAGVEVPYRMATNEEIAIAVEMDKFSSINQGTSIHIRGK